jgi:hypothetical protein
VDGGLRLLSSGGLLGGVVMDDQLIVVWLPRWGMSLFGGLEHTIAWDLTTGWAFGRSYTGRVSYSTADTYRLSMAGWASKSLSKSRGG